MSEPTQPARGPIAWMARNEVAANLAMVVIFIGGFMALWGVKQEIFPEFDLDVVTVTVPYPGASPSEVEQGIVLAVEEVVRGVDGVKKVTSASSEGAGVVTVEVLLGADPDKVLQDVKNEVDRIRTFPEDAEDPQVALISRKSKVISLILSGDQSLGTLHQIAEEARTDLLTRGGVTQVEIGGVPPLEVAIEVDRDTLRAYGLTLDDIARQVSLSSLELPGGGIDTEGGELLVRVTDRKHTAAEFADIVLRGTASGAEVRLGDVATIRDGFEDNDQATYFDGEPAVLLTAYRVGTETPTGVADTVKDFAQVLSHELPDGVHVTVWNDDSELLRGRIDLLVRNAQFGIVLVLLVLALFLDLKLAVWVGLGIPTSFLGAFFLFPGLDISVNMVSLFALIVTLGMVVDDAIVVGENIYEKMESGIPRVQAAIEGAKEMAMPVTFAILTTFAAFAPLLFVPGVSGKIFRIIPLVVLSVLGISLLESFFILPAHLSHDIRFSRAFHGVNARVGDLWDTLALAVDRPRIWVNRGLQWFIENLYDPFLTRVIAFRYASIGAAVMVLLVSFAMVTSGKLPFSFLPKTEADLIRVTARLPYGAPIERTEQVRAALEDALERAIAQTGAQSAIRGTLTLVGQGAEAGRGPGTGGRPVGSHLVSLEVDLVPNDQRDFPTARLADAWQAEVPALPGVEALTFVKDIGPSGGAAVDVQLSHSNTAVLADASNDVTQSLRSYAALTNVDNTYAAGKPQLDFEILPAGRSLGLTASDIARQIRSSFYGAEAIREQRGRNELKIVTRLPEDQRTSEYDLEQLDVRTPRGGWVPLSTVATFERSRAATSITREGGRRVVDVKAELAPGVKSSREVLEDLDTTVLPELRKKYPGLTVRFAGEQETQNESLASLGSNFLLALFVIYALLAVPFRSYVQPAIIMSVIPFGMVGAIWGHILMGYELSVISVMGIIALSGVVVNDSLVLIDAANGFRRDGMDAWQAVFAAGKRRMRPILLTSLTTFFGLAPMIVERSVQARFLIPMAVSLGFGVLFSTIIVLVLVPALYMIIDDVVKLWHWLYGHEDADAAGEPPGTDGAIGPLTLEP